MKTKLITLFVLLFHLYTNAQVQAPGWSWAKSAGGNLRDESRSICTDANGNVFVTGVFKTSMTLGTITLIAGNNVSNFFIAKYDASGNLLWAKTATTSAGNIGCDANDICTDANGNVLVTGEFGGASIAFGTVTLTNTYSPGGFRDIFVVKYDGAGNVLWAKSAGSGFPIPGDFSTSICTDMAGNVLITGCFNGPTIAFGSFTLTNTIVPPNVSGSDIFVTKYDASGNVLWVKSGIQSSPFGVSPAGICTDMSGNVLLFGNFASPSITFGSTVLTDLGGSDVYVVKYDASGNLLWAQRAGGVGSVFTESSDINTDAAGNIIINGQFMGANLAFGSITLSNSSQAGVPEVFLVKYNAAGNALWARQSMGALGGARKGRACVDASGNIYMIGHFYGPTEAFGSYTLTNMDNSSATADIFVVKYDGAGNVLWAKREGTMDDDAGIGVSVDPFGNVAVTGNFVSPAISFGSNTVTNAYAPGACSSTVSSNCTDVFIAKTGSNVATAIPETNNAYGFGIYPNPFSAQTTLKTDHPLKNATLVLNDCLGRIVLQMDEVSGGEIVLSRGGLPGGAYFIRVIQENKVIATQKLMIID